MIPQKNSRSLTKPKTRVLVSRCSRCDTESANGNSPASRFPVLQSPPSFCLPRFSEHRSRHLKSPKKNRRFPRLSSAHIPLPTESSSVHEPPRKSSQTPLQFPPILLLAPNGSAPRNSSSPAAPPTDFNS